MHYVACVWHSSALAQRIWGGGGHQHDMACAKLGTSGPQKYWRTRELQSTRLVKLAQKCQENDQTSQKGEQN